MELAPDRALFMAKSSIDRTLHWDSVYESKDDSQWSWTQAAPSLSLALIGEICKTGQVIDVGGGMSPLPARLLDLGYSVTILDVSEVAITRARARLGTRSSQVRWIVADVTANPELGTYDVWHDRAVFHFLVDQADRDAYATLLARTISIGGHAVIATFALDGPERCSGLEVRRYSGLSLAKELGTHFKLLKSDPEMHATPWGATQSFQYGVFERV